MLSDSSQRPAKGTPGGFQLPGDEGAEQSANLGEILRVLSKNIILIVAVAVAVVTAVTFFTLSQTKIYRASALLQIDPSPPSPLGRDVPAVISLGDGFWNNQEYYATQYKIIGSRGTAVDAVRALGLHKDLAFVRGLPPGSGAGERTEVSVEAAAGVLLGRLRIEPIKESRLVTLSFEDADPERARRVLSAVVRSYLQRNLDEAVSSNTSTSQWLRDQLSSLKGELEKSELALHEYKTDKQILSVSLDDQSNMLREEMQRLNQALLDVRTRRAHLESRQQEMSKINLNDPTELPVSELLENDLLNTLRSKYVTAKAELSGLMVQGKGENHPEVRVAAADVDAARDALVKEIKNVTGALSGDLAGANREASGLAGLLGGAKQHAMDLNLLEIQYRRLERTKDNNQKLYGMVLERAKESDLAGMMHFNNLHVIEEPAAVKSPVKPRVPINLGIGTIVGLILGLMAAIGKEQLDRSIKSSEGIERELGLPLLGTLPLTGSLEPRAPRRRGSTVPGRTTPELLVYEQPSSPLAEAARGIRTNLMFMSPDRPYRTMLVTSAGPGEGKTTVACVIALALAQAGMRVLLIDCDLRRPRLHRIFGRTNDLGTTSATVDPQSLERADLSTSVSNLDLLPAGPLVPTPAEFLHSAAFGALLSRLSSAYDRVVIDSPPAAVVSDSAILSTQVDGTVFVVRAGKTPRELARKAVRLIRGVSGVVIGSVLNAFDARRQGYGEYYAYQYEGYRPLPADGTEASVSSPS